MLAMMFDRTTPTLREVRIPDPLPAAGQLLIDVHACGACRTDLHVVDGDLAHPKLPLIPGHEIVGTVRVAGDGVTGFSVGDRVGAMARIDVRSLRVLRIRPRKPVRQPGIYRFTIDGGYAECAVADHRYCVHLPQRYSDLEAAPLLCATPLAGRVLA